MQYNVENLGQLKRAIHLEIPFDEFQSDYKKALTQAKNTRLKGFRPGKFPKGYVEKKAKEFLHLQVLDKRLPEYYDKILEETGMRPATQPQLENFELEIKKPIKCELKLEVVPEIAYPDVSKLKLEIKPVEISAEEVEENILQMRMSKAEYEPKEGAAELYDKVIVRKKMYQEGEELPDEWKEEEVSLSRKPEETSTYQRNLFGMSKGESKQFSWVREETVVPEHHHHDHDHSHCDHDHDHEHSHDANEAAVTETKTTHFEVEMVEVLKPVLPELNEEFFQEQLKVATEVEFRQKMTDLLKKRAESQFKQVYRQEVKKQLLAITQEMDVPEGPVAQRKEYFENELKTKEPELADEERDKQVEEKLAEAVDRLKVDLIIDALAHQHNLKPSEEDVVQQFSMFANMMGQNPNELFQTNSGQQFFQSMFTSLRESMVLDHLIDSYKSQQA